MLPWDTTTTLSLLPGTCLPMRRAVFAAATAFISRSSPNFRRALGRCSYEVTVSSAESTTAYASMIYALPSSPKSFSESLFPELSSSLLTLSSSVASLYRWSFVYDDEALPRRLFGTCVLNTTSNNFCGTLPSEGYVSRLVSLTDAFRARQEPFTKLPFFPAHTR